MTDYSEEQNSELEVLQSIYPEELRVLSEDPLSYEIFLSLEDVLGAPDYNSDEDLDQLVSSLLLTITYPPTYPDILPEWNITASSACGLDEADIEQLSQDLLGLAEESLGMAMVFTLASQLKESTLSLITKKAEDREREAEERLMQSIKADESKFIGTKVTPENFLEWKTKFDLERDALRFAELKKSGFKKPDSKKLTGKQLFEKDSKLAKSDMQFLEEGDEDVDATQFERLRLSDRDNGDEANNDTGVSVLDLLREDQD
ncbi:Protein gir2 [Entomophthora muscae]|uniref:Protein gir2 n=1 Tax=Entomophthora muscae TaxID=34485 RepID=A0ACC2SS50_9FUNG|nr:Protein gir2 [Entomophthora muscae]